MSIKRHSVFFGGEQVTNKDLDTISICVIRNKNCNGCICKDTPAGIIKDRDRRYKGCESVKAKFNVENPAVMEICLY